MLNKEVKVKRPNLKKREYLYMQTRFPVSKDKYKYIRKLISLKKSFIFRSTL